MAKAKAQYVLPLSNDYNVRSMCIPYPVDINHAAALWGQIYALASARVWQDDPDHKAIDAAAFWDAVIQDITVSDTCDPFSCPNGITIEIDPDDLGNTDGTAHDVLTYNCSDDNPDVLMVRNYAAFLGVAHMGYRVRKDGVTIGGTIPMIQMRTFESGSPQYCRIHWTDCLDNEHTETTDIGADFLTLENIQAKTFYLESLDSHMAVITLPHEVDCTPA
jgi:hypothetical protein